ncbi:MAG: hypothetical protein AB1679_25915 [Actinomycetota bacterium]
MKAKRVVVAVSAAVLTVTAGAGWAAGEAAPPPVRWGRLDASLDMSTFSAGQITGAIRVWGAHAYSHVDDSPSARAVGSPLDIGVLATAAGFQGVSYPLTSESLSPGGADKAEFSEASRSVEGVAEVKQVFSSATTSADPPTAQADGGGQAATTALFTASTYRAMSNLADDGRGKVAGNGVVSVDKLTVGPLIVQNVTTLVEGSTDGTEAGTKLSARTLVTGATVNDIPVEIGSSGVTASDQGVGADGLTALNEQIKTALASAGVLDVVVAEPKATKGDHGFGIEAGGLRVKFLPTPEMNAAVNAAVPLEAGFASGKANMLAVPVDAEEGAGLGGGVGGVEVEPLPGAATSPVPDSSSLPGVASSSESGFVAAPASSNRLGSRDGASGAGIASSAGPGPGSAAVPGDGSTSIVPAPAPPASGGGTAVTAAAPVALTRPSNGPWIAALAALSVALLAAMLMAARRATASGAGSGLRHAIDSLAARP